MFSEVFTIFGQRPAKENDANFIGSMVQNAIWTGLSELLPEIKVLDKQEYFDLEEVGDFDGIIEAFNEPIDPDNIQSLLSIFELYEMINSSWLGGADEFYDDDDYDDLTEEEEAEWEQAMISKYSTTSLTATPKPGRNEPCPCFSGKKYKKCCGKED